MKQLSDLVNYHHSNVYVHRQLLLKALQDFKDLQSRQYKNNVIEIPSYIIIVEVKKINKLLKSVNEKIQQIEQGSFAFGNSISNLDSNKD